jgi:hypothetical protein
MPRYYRIAIRGLGWSGKGLGVRNTGDDDSGRPGGLGVTNTQSLVCRKLGFRTNSWSRRTKEFVKASQLPEAQ